MGVGSPPPSQRAGLPALSVSYTEVAGAACEPPRQLLLPPSYQGQDLTVARNPLVFDTLLNGRVLLCYLIGWDSSQTDREIQALLMFYCAEQRGWVERRLELAAGVSTNLSAICPSISPESRLQGGRRLPRRFSEVRQLLPCVSPTPSICC